MSSLLAFRASLAPIDRVILDERGRGISYDAIGERLGISGQGVHKRWLRVRAAAVAAGVAIVESGAPAAAVRAFRAAARKWFALTDPTRTCCTCGRTRSAREFPGRKTRKCVDCWREYQTRRREAKIASGECVMCAAPARPGYQMCEEHAAKVARRKVERAAEDAALAHHDGPWSTAPGRRPCGCHPNGPHRKLCPIARTQKQKGTAP